MSVILIITFLGGIIELSLQTMTFIQIKFAELELFGREEIHWKGN